MGGGIMSNILLAGKPNSGKTSLFNLLTGLNQKVGNFSGVTTEIKKGTYHQRQIVDIPGLQSLNTTSPEELISRRQLLEAANQQRELIFVVNGMQLFDSLLLFSQIADLQIPLLVAINFADEIKSNGLNIDQKILSEKLGCPVVMLNSRTGEGLPQLKKFIDEGNFQTPNTFCRSLYDDFRTGDYQNHYQQQIDAAADHQEWEKDYNQRKQLIDRILKDCVTYPSQSNYMVQSQRWDKILLHPFWGLLIFLLTLYLVFQSVFFLSGYPMDWIEAGMDALATFCQEKIGIEWLATLFAEAIIPGLAGVVVFIPQIAILFFLIGLLEQIGYLSRISFISDAFLRKFGLSGHSVIPLLSSWACAIPAIMSARIIKNPRERLAIILASPLMTCSARLPVYTILITVLIPETSDQFFGIQGLLLLGLYLLGLIATLLVSWLIHRYSSVPANNSWVLELPVFRPPVWRSIFITVYNKTKSFVVQAGKIIFAISIILWLLGSYSPHDEDFLQQKQQETGKLEDAVLMEYSYLGYAGRTIEPVIRPLGYDWQIGIALLSSFAAREVFVGTIAIIYSIGDENADDEEKQNATIVERLRQEKDEQGNPRYGWATSISLLLFYVFAMQCMSTLAIVHKETRNWKYVIAQFVFMLFLAYAAAFVAYTLLS
ncbi:MAG: ferrous iron transport protein B [Bacteroidota bacterium]